MRFLPLSLLSLVFLLLSSPAVQAGRKAPKAYIGLHPEGSQEEGPRMVVPNRLGDETYYFRISPEISVRHFSAYSPFLAEDGTLGAVLHLNDEGRRALQVMCSNYGGKLARVIVNGRAIDTLRIDRPSPDGKIVLWQGLTKQDLALFDKSMKRLGDGEPKKS